MLRQQAEMPFRHRQKNFVRYPPADSPERCADPAPAGQERLRRGQACRIGIGRPRRVQAGKIGIDIRQLAPDRVDLPFQRLALAELMFGNGHRHMTAEQLFDDAREANQRVSLATVYNTLNQFAEAGLLNAVAADQGRTYFDTNVSDHHHFFMEDTGQLIDVPGDEVKVTGRPAAPEGYEIDQIQVVVRVRRKKQ